MSLINQVLQDLEKRHASEPELRSLPPHVRAVPGESPRRPAAATAAIVVILAIAAIVAVIVYRGSWPRPSQVVPAAVPAPAPAPAAPAPAPAARSEAPEIEAAVETQLLPPASRLSEELSFVPESRPRRESAARVDKPAAPKPAPAKIPPEFRAAIDPPASSRAPEPAVPAVAPPPVQPSQSVQVPPRAAEPTPAPVPAPAPAAPEAAKGSIDKQVREMTPQQRAEIAFRKGAAQLQDSRASAAEASFREALQEDPNHVAARQALLGLLLDAKRNDAAEKLLLQTLELNPRQPRHAMVLARLQVDRGEVTGAINTLVAALPYVQSDADYYAFLAALLQRENRHRETIDYYRAALRLSPGNAVWLMGLGISLRATSQFADAREVFQRALDTRQLNGDLKAFTERQLRELSTARK